MVSRSSALERSSTTLFLPRLNSGKNDIPMPPRLRVLSPAGGSTLMTSAPSCARIMPQVGPITMWVISMTLTPARGSSVPVISSPVSVQTSISLQTRPLGAFWKILSGERAIHASMTRMQGSYSERHRDVALDLLEDDVGADVP